MQKGLSVLSHRCSAGGLSLTCISLPRGAPLLCRTRSLQPRYLKQAEQMLDVASEKTPDLLAQKGDRDGEDLTAANPGTPPLSPSRYRKPSSGKEEGAYALVCGLCRGRTLQQHAFGPIFSCVCGETDQGALPSFAFSVWRYKMFSRPLFLIRKVFSRVSGHRPLLCAWSDPFQCLLFPE